MSTNRIIWALVVACGFALAPVVSRAASPNILFFLSDDQRADFMGCAGHPILKTPTMDSLAAGGVRFRNTFVTTSICAASRASILTGLVERTHRFTFGTPPIGKDFTEASYPTLLREKGYRTGFVGKFGVRVEKGQREVLFDYFKPLGRNPYHKKQPDGGTRHVSEIAGDLAIEFLRSCPENRPFCLSVSFNAPHAEDSDKENHFPWPKAVNGLYEDVKIPAPKLSAPEIFESQPEFLKKSLNRVRWYWRWDTPQKYQRNVLAYYRMISGVDGVMRRVLDELAKLGRQHDTVVIFSGDNGYYKGSRGFAGKWSHYQESLRVPLIVFDPRAGAERRGKIVDARALNIDIPATILELAEIDVPPSYDGRSLVPFLTGRRPRSWREDFFCEHLFANRQIPKWEGVRGERYVYARYFEQEPVYEFLHDLKDDPDQLRNFAGDESYSEILAKMRKRCDELRDAHGGVFRPWPKKEKK